MAENMTVEKRIALFDEALGNIVSPEFRAWLIENGFFTAPASTKYHGCYEGGLFDHSFVVMTSLIELSAKNGLAWGRAESPFIIGMFHDEIHTVIGGNGLDRAFPLIQKTPADMHGNPP